MQDQKSLAGIVKSLVKALLFLRIWSQWDLLESGAARVNSSHVRNNFWWNIMVLVIVLTLFVPFNQCTLSIQHKPHKTNASAFGLFVLDGKLPL